MIRASGVSKRFGQVWAVDGVSLACERSETVVVLGPSGCGKTTLLRLIAGLETPDAGEIDIEGSNVSSPGRLVAHHRRGVSMIFQDLALWPHLSVFGNVAFGLRGNGQSRVGVRSVVDEALRRVALLEHRDRYPHQLSGGERQRLAIARALAGSPRYVLMDEPFSSLDPLLKRRMIDLLRELRADLGLGILYVTHNLDEALALGDRILLMSWGRVAGALNRKQVASLTQPELLEWYEACIVGEPDC
jgi:ABC-type Fe3+/spermidine/putrescine transport system ATPase subunit